MKKYIVGIIFSLLAVGFIMPTASAQIGASRVVSTRKVDAKKIEKPKKERWKEPVKTGWQNTLLLNYEFPICPGLHWNTGYRINKLMYIGAGLGYNFDFITPIYSHINTHWSNSYNGFYVSNPITHRFPLYAQLGFYIIGERKVNPYIGVSQGVDLIYYKQNPASDKMLGLGSHTRLDLGANFRLPKSGHNILFTFDLGISPVGEKYYKYISHAFYTGFNIGFTF